MLEQADQARVVGGQSPGQHHTVLQSQSPDSFVYRFAISLIRARSRQHQQSLGMLLENPGRLFDQPTLILYRVDTPHAQQDLFSTDLREGLPSRRALVLSIQSQRHSMSLDQNAFGGILLTQQIRFVLIAGYDGVGVPEQTVRLENQPKELSPFPPRIVRGIETLFHFVRQVEHPAMYGYHERDLPLLSHSQSDPPNPT